MISPSPSLVFSLVLVPCFLSGGDSSELDAFFSLLYGKVSILAQGSSIVGNFSNISLVVSSLVSSESSDSKFSAGTFCSLSDPFSFSSSKKLQCHYEEKMISLLSVNCTYKPLIFAFEFTIF